MSDLFAELEWRGFVHHATQEIGAHLAAERRTVYCGFDPTASSLQLGNLMPIMLLRHFQLAGHKPIVLMGGGTGLIGDPSGKRGERTLLSKEQIRENLQRQRDQMARLLDFDGPAQALVLNNADWLVKQSLVDFLRDVGKHFSVNIMLQKESVKARLDTGISYTEFSYMLLQAYDFLHLYQKEGCTIQVGGSDQWGNITAGVDPLPPGAGGAAHALLAPRPPPPSGRRVGPTGGRVLETLAQEIPTTTIDGQDALTLVDALVRSGLAKSKSEARRAIEQGGIYLNQEREKNVERRIEPGDRLADGSLLLRKGKKDYALIRTGA